MVTAPETAARQRLIDALNAEFLSEEFVFSHDKLNDSLGREGKMHGGVYPGPTRGRMGVQEVLETTLYVQLFLPYDAKVDAKQAVDPTTIETYAERFRRAAQADQQPGAYPADEHLWFYMVTGIEYPPDPTGNITRFVATVVATSQNAGLVETAG